MARITADLQRAGLRPGQKEVMHDLQDFFLEHDKGYIAMPTGSGKTVLFATLVAAQEMKSLIVVPTKQLMAQTLAELTARGVDNVLATSDMRSRHDKQKRAEARAVVTTYAQLVSSIRNTWGASILDPADFGMVILDEAHHVMADGARRALKQYDHAFQLGFTATPDYSEARKLTEQLPKIVHELRISEAIDMGLIAPYVNTLLLTGGDMATVKVVRNEYDAKRLEQAINTSARNDAIATFIATELPTQKTMVSCSSIAHARDMTAALRSRGAKAAYVHGRMPKREIESTLASFRRGDITILCNNKLLSEGFDDPTIAVVVNASPTLSPVRQQQRTGRGLRIDPDNSAKEVLIIDCIDANYRAKPVLFMDPAIAGSTGIRSDSSLLPTLRTLAQHKGSASLLATEHEITEYLDGLSVISPARTKRAKKVVPEAQVHEGVVKFLGFTIINGELQRTTPRSYDVDRPSTLFRHNGLCAQTDMDAFFPEKGGSTREAKRVCQACDIREDCLEVSLATQERFGIWGGLSERERRKVSKLVTTFMPQEIMVSEN